MDVKSKYFENKQNLTRIWTERLYREYDNILFHFSIRMVPPQIVINESLANLGLWNSETRTISIARSLIENHSWDIVIEVLKHEMAHQIVSEKFQFYELHGTLFKKACKMLGVSDWAASATGKLPEQVPSWREKKLSEDDERLLKRAEKLLALAESANEHEAELAMRRVRELYEKYNFEHIRNNVQPDLVYAILCRKKRKTDTIDSMILSILNKHFFVKVLHTTQYDAFDCCEYKAAEILGTRQNVLMAEYVFFFLRQKIEGLSKAFKKANRCDGIQARSYALGLLTGFMQKMDRESTEGRSSESQALVKIGEQLTTTYLHERHPKLTNRRYGASYRDSGSFEAGKSDGGKISISKGVTARSTNSGRLLTK